MVGKYKVITLCGSTRFKDAFLQAQKRLTLEGNIVISVGLFGHSGDTEVLTEGVKEMLDDMHKRKIDMADEIFVVNVRGYIGSSTRSEIEYAEKTGFAVNYFEMIIGHYMKNKDDMKEYLMTVSNGIDEYVEARERIKNIVYDYPDNRSTERVYNEIMKAIDKRYS